MLVFFPPSTVSIFVLSVCATLLSDELQPPSRFQCARAQKLCECGKIHCWQPLDGCSIRGPPQSAPFRPSPFRRAHSWVHTHLLPPLCFQMHPVTPGLAPQRVKLPFPISEEKRSPNFPVLLRHQVPALPAEPSGFCRVNQLASS